MTRDACFAAGLRGYRFYETAQMFIHLQSQAHEVAKSRFIWQHPAAHSSSQRDDSTQPRVQLWVQAQPRFCALKERFKKGERTFLFVVSTTDRTEHTEPGTLPVLHSRHRNTIQLNSFISGGVAFLSYNVLQARLQDRGLTP